MYKIHTLVLASALVICVPLAYAQTIPANNGSNTSYQNAMKARYSAAGGRGMGMNPLMSKEKMEKFMQSLMEMGLLYRMLAQPTMVSTDNGIIVAYGNTIRKFDKDLNLVKEVDLDINPDSMQDLASKLSKKYTADFMDLMGGMGGPVGPSSMSPSTMSPSSMGTSYTGTNSMGTATPVASSPGLSHPASGQAYDEKREAEIKKEIEQMK
jgi:hypothetical protein